MTGELDFGPAYAAIEKGKADLEAGLAGNAALERTRAEDNKRRAYRESLEGKGAEATARAERKQGRAERKQARSLATADPAPAVALAFDDQLGLGRLMHGYPHEREIFEISAYVVRMAMANAGLAPRKGAVDPTPEGLGYYLAVGALARKFRAQAETAIGELAPYMEALEDERNAYPEARRVNPRVVLTVGPTGHIGWEIAQHVHDIDGRDTGRYYRRSWELALYAWRAARARGDVIVYPLFPLLRAYFEGQAIPLAAPWRNNRLVGSLSGANRALPAPVSDNPGFRQPPAPLLIEDDEDRKAPALDGWPLPDIEAPAGRNSELAEAVFLYAMHLPNPPARRGEVICRTTLKKFAEMLWPGGYRRRNHIQQLNVAFEDACDIRLIINGRTFPNIVTIAPRALELDAPGNQPLLFGLRYPPGSWRGADIDMQIWQRLRRDIVEWRTYASVQFLLWEAESAAVKSAYRKARNLDGQLGKENAKRIRDTVLRRIRTDTLWTRPLNGEMIAALAYGGGAEGPELWQRTKRGRQALVGLWEAGHYLLKPAPHDVGGRFKLRTDKPLRIGRPAPDKAAGGAA